MIFKKLSKVNSRDHLKSNIQLKDFLADEGDSKKVPSKKNVAKVKVTPSLKDLTFVRKNINLIQDVAKSQKLPSHCILKLVDGIGSSQLKISQREALLNCIVPHYGVPEDALIRMTFFLSDLNFDVNLKVYILKWMCKALLLNSSMTKLHCLYGIYLKLLNYKLLRPHVIALLKVISTKENVTSDRISYIFSLMSVKELEDDFFPILDIYSDLQPSPFFQISHNFKVDSFGDSNSEMSSRNSLQETGGQSSNSAEISRTGVQTCKSFPELCRKLDDLKKSAEEIIKSDYRRLLLTSISDLSKLTWFYDYLLTASCLEKDFEHSLPLISKILLENQEFASTSSDFIDRILDIWDGCSSSFMLLDILAYFDIFWFKMNVDKINFLKKSLQTAPLIYKCYFLYCLTRKCEEGIRMMLSNDYINPEFNLTTPLAVVRMCFQVKHLIYFSTYTDIACYDTLADEDVHPWVLKHILNHSETVWMMILYIINAHKAFSSPPYEAFETILCCLSPSDTENVCKMLWHLMHINWKVQSKGSDIKKDFINSLFRFYCIIKYKNLNRNADQQISKIISSIENYFPDFKCNIEFVCHPIMLKKIVGIL